MRLVVNGQDRDVAEPLSVAGLLDQLGIPRQAVVVERNGEVLRRESHEAVLLAPEDRLEIVRFVGGG